MRRVRAVALVGTLLWSSAASAELPRDYFLDPPTAGTFFHSDVYNVGVQESLEQRSHLEEGMSMLHLRASGIASYPYADGSANVDARVFLFTLGASAGYRHVYRDHTFAPDEDRSRQARLDREENDEIGSQGFPYAEGRLRLVIPLDIAFMVNTATVRWEDGNDNSFDWFHGIVHDSGTMFKYEGVLFFRHRDFGGVGPAIRYMNVPRLSYATGESKRRNEFHYGFALGTRPGFVKPRHGNADLFLLQALFKFGDETYGVHSYRIPVSWIAAYRASLKIL